MASRNVSLGKASLGLSGQARWMDLWFGLAVLPFGLMLAALAVPVLWTHGYALLALVLQNGFSLICHQRAERSFMLLGGSVAVCARCLGVYLGAAAGMLLCMPRRFAVRFFASVLLLNLTDVATEAFGLHGNWIIVRFTLGMLLGLAGAAVVSATRNTASTFRPASG